LYACGLSWLKLALGFTWSKTLAVGMFPFLAGDAFKIVAAAAIAKSLRPVMTIKRAPSATDADSASPAARRVT
jgi:biotin transport system substrate-specific component